jgi:hypothetical protein
MKQPRRYALCVATVGAAAVGSLVYGWSGLRLAAALVLCVLLPGWGWARRLKPADRGDTLALAVVLSLCATVAVSTAMVLADRWSWTVGATCLAGIAALGFVPARRLLGGLGLRIRWRLSARDITFLDWHAGYAERRRLRAEAEEAAAIEWTDWYAEQQRLADEAAAREWTGWLVAEPDQAAQPEQEGTTVLSFPPSTDTDTAGESR